MTTPRLRWYRDDEPMPISRTTAWALDNAAFASGVVDAGCDNVIASSIGEACDAAAAAPAGDTIDRGLALVRLLRAAGFAVVKVP